VASRRGKRLGAAGSAKGKQGGTGAEREADVPEDDGTWLVSVIERAYDNTKAYGATTLLLATLRGADLVAACLGDCALLVLRPHSPQPPLRFGTVFKTEPGRYDSRRPVQVQRLQGFSDAHAHTVIQGAMVSTTPVQPGDFLVLGSDGLFDNLRDEDIMRTVERCCCSSSAFPWRQRGFPGVPAPQAAPAAPSREQLQRAAATLVDLAISRVRLDLVDATSHTPWNVQGDVPANNADDTTAIVALVAEDGPQQSGLAAWEALPLHTVGAVNAPPGPMATALWMPGSDAGRWR